MKKLITYLYHRFCKPEVKSLYINAIQRDFSRILSEKEVLERNIEVYNFIQTGWLEQIINEHLKKKVEVILNTCETKKHTEYMLDTIKDVMSLEDKFKTIGVRPEGKIEFDKTDL